MKVMTIVISISASHESEFNYAIFYIKIWPLSKKSFKIDPLGDKKKNPKRNSTTPLPIMDVIIKFIE